MDKATVTTKNRRLIAAFSVLACVVLGTAAITGCMSQASSDEAEEQEDSRSLANVATVDYSSEGSYKDNIAELPEAVNNDLGAENAEKNAPMTYVDEHGFTVQPTPDDGTGWNISYLNADSRGCTSCHTLEDALMSLDTYHGFIFNGYNTEQTFSQCVQCHIWANPLKDSIHSTHLSSDLFEAQNGNCESCHYVDDEGNYLRWDYERYSVLKGITDIDADTVQAEVSYDQDTTSTVDQMFYKSIKEYGDDYDPINWRTDDSNMDPALYENWVFTIDGDVENPISMTLPELVEKFGTTTAVMKQQCCINGYGNATIYQCEVTGVSMKDIIDYVKPKSNVNAANIETEDNYPGVDTNYNVPFDAVNVEDCILVTEISGETLPNSQGYPASLWVPRSSAACNYKVCMGVSFIETDEADAASGYYLGGFEDSYKDQTVAGDKPNSAVLNYPSGVVLEDMVGKEIELEGFADAYDEPITKIEYSFDHGATWIEMETPDNDPTYWTYWRLKFTPPAEGAYLLTIRTTSQQADGSEHVCAYNTEFLMNVK